MSDNKLIVFFYDSRHVKQFICAAYGQMYTNESPKHAHEFNHKQAVHILNKHGKKYGGGFENSIAAYTEYLSLNKTPLDKI